MEGYRAQSLTHGDHGGATTHVTPLSTGTTGLTTWAAILYEHMFIILEASIYLTPALPGVCACMQSEASNIKGACLTRHDLRHREHKVAVELTQSLLPTRNRLFHFQDKIVWKICL